MGEVRVWRKIGRFAFVLVNDGINRVLGLRQIGIRLVYKHSGVRMKKAEARVKLSEMAEDDIYAEIKAYVAEQGGNLDEDYRWYVYFCQVVAAYVHDKCGVYEIMKVTDGLSDLLLRGLAGFQNGLPLWGDERIQGQVRAFEFFDETQGLLTYNEKEAWAFCSYWAFCLQGYDEQKEQLTHHFDDFQDSAAIDRHYRFWKETYTDLFQRHVPSEQGRFAFDKTHPVQAISIPASKGYLNRLKPCRGWIVGCERKGSLNNGAGIIDHWVATVAISASERIEVSIYVDPYCETTSEHAPEGWLLTCSNRFL